MNGMVARIVICLFAAYAVFGADAEKATPVLAELFTAEGCSSCPPADTLLEKLDQLQPVQGARIIVMSEHVDYWNYDGWRDPFSSSDFTARQTAYTQRFKQDTNYTPQLVVDGREQFLGSDAQAILAGVSRAMAIPKIAVHIASAKLEGRDAVIEVEAASIPESAPFKRANIWVALADAKATSSVGKGENAGRTLTHVAVVRKLKNIGGVNRSNAFNKTVRLPLVSNGGEVRVVAFIQQDGTGVVAGADLVRLEAGN